MNINSRILSFIFSFFLILGVSASSLYADQSANSSPAVCAVYITGSGCSNCAAVDPALLRNVISLYPDLIIFEYEIYHASKENKAVSDLYFKNYYPGRPSGVPFLIFSKEKNAMGRMKIFEFLKTFDSRGLNPCPLADGSSVDFSAMDLTKLVGKVSIWTKNRVLLTSKAGGDNAVLKRLLLAPNLWQVLKDIPYVKADPVPVEISQNVVLFQYAVMVGEWLVQWNGDGQWNDSSQPTTQSSSGMFERIIPWLFVFFIFSFILILFTKIEKTERGLEIRLRNIEKKRKDYLVVAGTMIVIVVFFIFAKTVSSVSIEKAGYALPLPLFTLIIGLLDGVNPCNMFVLTCLMALLVSTSHSKLRLYVVGISFVLTCFVLYFLFMAAWLNVFQYISFIKPLRIGIGFLALIAGVINCKELLFFKKGVSLTIPDEQRGFLMRKIYAMKKAIEKGSFPLLVWASFALAILSSLVEIPCTAGFPIIYTGILAGKVLENTFSYYAYLVFYNVLYVLPLLTIVTIFVTTFKGQPISQRQMEILKFVGGVIMILLGIILLVNPSLIGVSMG